MDTVRFLNFLQSFASSASTRMQSLPEADSLSSTLSAFESQLRALMAPDQTAPSGSGAALMSQGAEGFVPYGPSVQVERTASSILQPENGTQLSSVFVIGGGAPASSAVAAPAVEASTPERATLATAMPEPETPQPFKAPLAALQQIVAWQREQINPMLHVRIGDTWERQGIADPLNHPGLLAQAQQVYERAANFKAHMPGYVAAWEKPWKVPAPVQMAASQPDTSGFVTGGRG